MNLNDVLTRYSFPANTEIINLCKTDTTDRTVGCVLYSETDGKLVFSNSIEEFERQYLNEGWKVLWPELKDLFTYEMLFDLLKSARTIDDIKKYQSQMIEMIPGYECMIHYDQNNPYHQYTLEDHSLQTVVNLPRDMGDNMLYLAALIHDITKPDCCMKNGKDEYSHYYGHPEKSYEYTRDVIIPYMEKHGYVFRNDDKDPDKCRLLYYVRYHDDHVSMRRKHLIRHLKMVNFRTFQRLMMLEVADAQAHVMFSKVMERIYICNQWASEYGKDMYWEEITEEEEMELETFRLTNTQDYLQKYITATENNSE